MDEFPSIFSRKPRQTSLLSRSIKVTSPGLIICKPYPIPLTKLGIVEHEDEKMREVGVIEPSRLPYSSPLLLVKKADSTFRPDIDFRRLNKVTVFYAKPKQNPEIIFTKVGQDKYLSKIYFSQGYWQIPMKQEYREKTVFLRFPGLFHFRVMPFGVANAGTSYSRMMRTVLDGLDHVDNYADDVLVHTMTWAERLATLRALFVRVRQAGLTVKPTKCYLGYKYLDCVGHHIVQDEVKTPEHKVNRIRNAPIPTT